MGVGLLAQVHGHVRLDVLLRRQFLFNLIAAPAFLGVALAFLKWPDVGLQWPSPAKSLVVLWLPALWIVGLLCLACAAGLPAPGVVETILANTLLAGVSEELMFRGVLFAGLLSRFSVWQTVWLTSALFGALHALNGFVTGDAPRAVMQALGAAMIGVLFAAIRLRTRSLLPGMLTHGLWDFATVLALTATKAANMPDVPLNGPRVLVALATETPFLIYGLFLLRRIPSDFARGADR